MISISSPDESALRAAVVCGLQVRMLRTPRCRRHHVLTAPRSPGRGSGGGALCSGERGVGVGGSQVSVDVGAGQRAGRGSGTDLRSEEHTSELQSRENLVCRLLLEKKNKNI